ncbi:MAG: AAA family ATPase [Actinobacteria bacterium]|nr:AAA family ATPase [Actinomycetota bacterium]
MDRQKERQAEQAYIDAAYDRLEAMREAAREMGDAVLNHGPGGTFQARFQRDVIVHNSLVRMAQLEIGDESLCFGRVDTEDSEKLYIGRLAVSGESMEPLVIDWRAPAAEAFYRATGLHPLGLVRRRHFLTDGQRVLDLEDEHFTAEGVEPDEMELAGTGALLAALERSRTGQMRDIVATVQREQDEVIRADPSGVLVVQGGPGTGKTAVALHRAAYLLFTYRRRLERQGVLVVGPNPIFLRYIEKVLPSLGETGVELSTASGLVAGARVTGIDSAHAARVKGDPRMAEFISRAVVERQRALSKDLSFWFDDQLLGMKARHTTGLVSSVRRRSGSHNGRRAMFEKMFFRRLYGDYVAAVDPAGRTLKQGGVAPLSEREFCKELRELPPVTQALNEMWPTLTPHQLLHDLFRSKEAIEVCGKGLLSESERQAIYRDPGPTSRSTRWTAADVPLLDEARVHLGTGRRRGSEEEDEPPAFGHIVVDEAQDLSPMQLRVLARRSLHGSMTLVGDIAQATGSWAPDSWDEILKHLPHRYEPRVQELTINYRTPKEIMDLANSVLASMSLSVKQPRSVRSTGSQPEIVSASAGSSLNMIAKMARQELDAVGDGTVAVITASSATDEVADALTEAGLSFEKAGSQALRSRLSLIPVDMVKGLEFDSVVLVEPADILAGEMQPNRALFVALSRSTRRLVIVHAKPLPSMIDQSKGLND